MIKYFLEIKNRCILLFFTWLTSLFICYLHKETLLFLIIQPNKLITNNLTSFYFIFTNVTEIFSVYIQLITFLSFQLFFFYMIYHIFSFLSFAMFRTEFYYFKVFLKLSLVNWLCSIFFSNFVLVPITWNFFLSFQNIISAKFITLHFESKLTEYLSFYILMYYLSVCYCQIFTILFFFLNSFKNKTKTTKKFRKLFYYFFVVFSTLISPPDVFSQIFVSSLFILLYEVLVFSFLLQYELTR
jgi:sec-independent protein translocase protein TatC